MTNYVLHHTRGAEAGEFSFGMDKKEGEEQAEVDARAELQSLLELQCVTRASRCVCVATVLDQCMHNVQWMVSVETPQLNNMSTSTHTQNHIRASAEATADNGAKPPPDATTSSRLQLGLLDRERLDALAARDETELTRLRQLPPLSSSSSSSSSSSNDVSRGEATLMDAAGLPTWLARLEEQMLGLGGSKETEWGIVAPDSKRRRVARFDSLSDAAIYRQRRQEGDEEEAEAAAERASLSSSSKGRKKPAAGGGGNGASRTPPPLAPAPPDAECVKCLVEGRLAQGREEEALVMCASCVNPYHRSCLGAGRGKRCCAFCEAEE